MLIAVTGATGFLGRYIVNHLLQQGHTCRCWHRLSSDRGGFINDGQGIEWLEGQLNAPDATRALLQGVDAVVHSALERGDHWSPTPDRLIPFVETNILGSLRLIDAAYHASIGRFVFISTCAVHDVILDDRPLDEAHPLWPLSHYGAHKAAIEKFVHSYGLPTPGINSRNPSGWPICCLRPTGIYGVAHPPEHSRWFNLIQDVVNGKPIETAAGGKEVHAADVAQAVGILLSADPAKIAGQSFNCYDVYISQEQVARVAKDYGSSSSPISDLNQGPKHQIDTSKIRALGMTFGGNPLLEKTVKQLVDAVKAPGKRHL